MADSDVETIIGTFTCAVIYYDGNDNLVTVVKTTKIFGLDAEYLQLPDVNECTINSVTVLPGDTVGAWVTFGNDNECIIIPTIDGFEDHEGDWHLVELKDLTI